MQFLKDGVQTVVKKIPRNSDRMISTRSGLKKEVSPSLIAQKRSSGNVIYRTEKHPNTGPLM